GAPGAGPDLNNVSPRKNLNETAFFFPHLTAAADGTVRLEFTVPEALTRWKLLGFVHDRELRSGFVTDTLVTAKDLMAQPNPPRFLREGDQLEFTVKVSNSSAARQKGTARLSFKETRTDKPVDAQLGLANPDQPFDLAAGESRTLSWTVSVPDDTGPLTYKAVAATDKLSDGEEGVIPVLSRRVLVTESLPLPIRGPGAKDFEFVKLRKSGESDTLRHQSYTVQMVSQPAWYAVMALPYLMEYPHECAEQTFNRLYANALARHIANSDPKVRKIFDQWKNTPALDSPLEKNQDLKAVVLEETPWVRQAQAESAARKNVGTLFDDNRLNAETARQLQKLADMQYADGSWPWFPGGRGNDYITLYITTGFGRMRHLGVKIDTASAVRAIDRLDHWANEQYQWALKHRPDENRLTPTMALYLYGRSFFLKDKPVADGHGAMRDYWLGQSQKYWLQLANRQSQAHLALALKRFGVKDAPQDIMRSIKERSKTDDELGMYWRDTELSFSWVRAPIETQAMMVEAFDEVMSDEKAVEDCKVWLLKQKQTQDWKTTKATADAVYALLLRGDKMLASDALVEVKVGGTVIRPEKVEAGTGFYEHKFVRDEVKPSMGAVQVTKADKGVSWGSVHWSYLEDVGKVTPHEGTPLKLEKKLYKKTLTKAGPVINPVKEGEALAVGDEVIVRVVLRTDRDMEYVHLKDHRGSGTEPVNVLSRYKYQDGLGYYESAKDTATHFFIDYLPKGVYVFEYPVRVQHRGKYPTGFAHIECMYAPEFNSHSENINLEVK
ncbi:MAG: alpha-2-macroglobulin family protein, partial [Gemmata sp.]